MGAAGAGDGWGGRGAAGGRPGDRRRFPVAPHCHFLAVGVLAVHVMKNHDWRCMFLFGGACRSVLRIGGGRSDFGGGCSNDGRTRRHI